MKGAVRPNHDSTQPLESHAFIGQTTAELELRILPVSMPWGKRFPDPEGGKFPGSPTPHFGVLIVAR